MPKDRTEALEEMETTIDRQTKHVTRLEEAAKTNGSHSNAAKRLGKELERLLYMQAQYHEAIIAKSEPF